MLIYMKKDKNCQKFFVDELSNSFWTEKKLSLFQKKNPSWTWFEIPVKNTIQFNDNLKQKRKHFNAVIYTVVAYKKTHRLGNLPYKMAISNQMFWSLKVIPPQHMSTWFQRLLDWRLIKKVLVVHVPQGATKLQGVKF